MKRYLPRIILGCLVLAIVIYFEYNDGSTLAGIFPTPPAPIPPGPPPFPK